MPYCSKHGSNQVCFPCCCHKVLGISNNITINVANVKAVHEHRHPHFLTSSLWMMITGDQVISFCLLNSLSIFWADTEGFILPEKYCSPSSFEHWNHQSTGPHVTRTRVRSVQVLWDMRWLGLASKITDEERLKFEKIAET
jgi:hypothetical protein